MRYSIVLLLFLGLFVGSCRDARIHNKEEWGGYFTEEGIPGACFILRDNNHEAVYYYNKERCLERFAPAATFDIFNSLVALEIPKVPDEQFVIGWDSVDRGNEAWNQDMNLRDAFKINNPAYFQTLARRIGPDYMLHYLDTASYGNRTIGEGIDSFWMNDSLKISADEQVGLIKRLYFNELPFTERTQRIVRSMMLKDRSDNHKLSYVAGNVVAGDSAIYWVVGYAEHIMHVKEDERSMNKSDIRMYPYFFAMNFSVPAGSTAKNWTEVSTDIAEQILHKLGALPDEGSNKK